MPVSWHTGRRSAPRPCRDPRPTRSTIVACRCPGPARRAARASCATPTSLQLWTAETISQLGTQVSALAIPFVAIEILQASTFEVALLERRRVPAVPPDRLPAGVWVDRLRRRPMMIAGDLGRAIALATIPLAYLLGRPDDHPALRRRLRRRRPDRLLRRRLPELPALARRARPAPGGQREAGDQPGGRPGGRPGARRRPDRRCCGRRSPSPSTRSRSWLGALPLLDPAAGAGARRPRTRTGRPSARDAPRDRRGAALRARPPRTSSYIAACTATVEPVRQHRLRGPPRLRRPELGMTAAAIGLAFSIGAIGRARSAPWSPTAISGRLGVGPTILVFAARRPALPRSCPSAPSPPVGPSAAGASSALRRRRLRHRQVSLRQVDLHRRIQVR